MSTEIGCEGCPLAAYCEVVDARLQDLEASFEERETNHRWTLELLDEATVAGAQALLGGEFVGDHLEDADEQFLDELWQDQFGPARRERETKDAAKLAREKWQVPEAKLSLHHVVGSLCLENAQCQGPRKLSVPERLDRVSEKAQDFIWIKFADWLAEDARQQKARTSETGRNPRMCGNEAAVRAYTMLNATTLGYNKQFPNHRRRLFS